MIRNALLVLAVMAQPVLAHPDGQAAPSSRETSDPPGREAPKDDRPEAADSPRREAPKADRPEAADSGEEILPAPATYKASGVTVAEKLGAKVPLDARFRDQDGKVVTLGEVLAGEIPTILTFNYSDCPMLCSLQLNGLSAVLPSIVEKKDNALFRVGAQFRIVTIDLEPSEELAKMNKMRDRYLAKLPAEQRPAARAGWTFLVAERSGDGAAIRRVADAVGFAYTYIPERAEWAHPAALIFLSVKGIVTRYVYGIEFDEQVMRDSIFKAGISEPATAVGFMNRCYHFDPDANNHSRAGVLALRIGAAGAVVLLLSGLGVMHLIRRQRPDPLHGKGNRA